jgi:hypothetical protein
VEVTSGIQRGKRERMVALAPSLTAAFLPLPVPGADAYQHCSRPQLPW